MAAGGDSGGDSPSAVALAPCLEAAGPHKVSVSPSPLPLPKNGVTKMREILKLKQGLPATNYRGDFQRNSLPEKGWMVNIWDGDLRAGLQGRGGNNPDPTQVITAHFPKKKKYPFEGSFHAAGSR